MNWKQKLIKEIQSLQEEPTREGIIQIIKNFKVDKSKDKLGDSFTKFLESEGYEVRTVK